MFDPLKIQENDQDLTLLECSTSNRFIFKDMERKCQNLSSEGEEETGISRCWSTTTSDRKNSHNKTGGGGAWFGVSWIRLW